MPIMESGIASQNSGLEIGLEQAFYDYHQQLSSYKETWVVQDLLQREGRDAVALVVIGMFLFLQAICWSSCLVWSA